MYKNVAFFFLLESSKNLTPTYSFRCLNVDGKQRVASRGSIVHSSLADFTQAVSLGHHLLDFSNALNGHNAQVFDVDAFVFVLLKV